MLTLLLIYMELIFLIYYMEGMIRLRMMNYAIKNLAVYTHTHYNYLN